MFNTFFFILLGTHKRKENLFRFFLYRLFVFLNFLVGKQSLKEKKTIWLLIQIQLTEEIEQQQQHKLNESNDVVAKNKKLFQNWVNILYYFYCSIGDCH
jgi:cell division protein FtsB